MHKTDALRDSSHEYPMRRVHMMIEEQKKYYELADYAVESIMEDPNLASDYELSNYGDDDLDGDFQHYLPSCLLRDEKSIYCHEYYGDLSYLFSSTR